MAELHTSTESCEYGDSLNIMLHNTVDWCVAWIMKDTKDSLAGLTTSIGLHYIATAEAVLIIDQAEQLSCHKIHNPK